MTEQEIKNETVAETVKFGCRVVGALGAGLIVGTACMMVPIGFVTGPLKAVTYAGALGIADFFGEVAGNQLAHRVDDVRSLWRTGEAFSDNYRKAKEQVKEQQVAEKK